MIKEYIFNYLEANALKEVESKSDQIDLIGEGYLDSMLYLQLLSDLELEFDVELDFTELDFDKVTKLDCLIGFIEGLTV